MLQAESPREPQIKRLLRLLCIASSLIHRNGRDVCTLNMKVDAIEAAGRRQRICGPEELLPTEGQQRTFVWAAVWRT